jgi:Protein of unknown function (DUF3618)
VTQPTGTAAPAAAPDVGSQPRTTDEIEAEIEATRTALVGRIETLQHRLSPGSVAQVARDRVLRVVKRDDGSYDPVRVSVATGVAVVLFLYVVRRAKL